MIDRTGPTLRPSRPVRGYQKWRSLLFLHWPVPAAALRPLVPISLEIDQHEGVAWVGVVPFAMVGVRPRWWPQNQAFDFLETNVRTYVHHQGQPGVYFFSLDAASSLAVWAARRFWQLPYYHAEMSHRIVGDEVHYRTARRGTTARNEVRYRIGKALDPSQPDSLEFFFLERYLLFVQRRGITYSGQVHHVPYPAHLAEVLELEDTLLQTAGLEQPTDPPAYVHCSPGVDVEIFELRAVG